MYAYEFVKNKKLKLTEITKINCNNYNTSNSIEQYKHLKQNETVATEPPITHSHLFSREIVRIRHVTLSAASIGFKYSIKYLYKRDSNTSKRTCILIHNYLKEKTRKKKESFLIS